MYPPAATVLISTVVHNVARDFRSLTDALLHSEHFANQISPSAVSDELSRFKLWAGNIAAHRRGRRSLEHRLRDADSLRCATHDVLKDLATALHNSLAIVKGDKTPWDEVEFSDSESDTSTDNLQGQTELKQLLASIAAFVTSLFRLSMAIRDPAPSNQSTRTISADKSYFEPHDILHVQAKFPSAAGYLSERLGRAISARRQYLSYREEHHKRLVKHIEKIEFEESKTEHTSNSTEATPMPQINEKTSLPMLEEDDGASQTSFAPSFDAPIRAPSMPKEAQDLEFYECPLCFIIISIHEEHMWRQHVYRDLHPYSCTFPHCTTADRLYDSRHEWFQHELEAHRMAWGCVEGCSKVFDTQPKFDEHIQKHHPDLIKILPVLKHTSARGANIAEQVQCPLCSKSMSLKALQKHVASHQQQLALFALPPSLDETKDACNDEGDEIAQMPRNVDDTDKTSDLSDIEGDDESPTPNILWQLCTQNYYWRFFHNVVQSSNTDQPPSAALNDPLSWTEVLPSLVSIQAIEEAGFQWDHLGKTEGPFRSISQDRIVIEKVLQWPQVRQLVERTAEIDRERRNRDLEFQAETEATNLEEESQEAREDAPVGVKAAQMVLETAKSEDDKVKLEREVVQDQMPAPSPPLGSAGGTAPQFPSAGPQQEAMETSPRFMVPQPPPPDTAKEDGTLAQLEKLLLGEAEEDEKAAEAARKAAESAKFDRLENILIAQQEARAAKDNWKAKQKTAEEAAIAAQEELEKAKKAAEEEVAKLKPSDAPKAPIKFKDAVGRKFSFPWHLCKTWKGMEELIKQAFLHVDIIGPHVHEGHYDLVGPDGELILPQVWETMVQPDWAITMHMWPMPDPPSPLEPPKEMPPPPPPVHEYGPFHSYNLPLAKSKSKKDKVKLKREAHPHIVQVPPPPPPPPPPPGPGGEMPAVMVMPSGSSGSSSKRVD